MLRAGTPPDQVLDFLAHTLTNKLMHPPSATLRRVDPQLRPELLAAARVLFGLSSTARSDGEAHGPTQDEDPEQ
jgi:glutamyl-tRNA reductase